MLKTEGKTRINIKQGSVFPVPIMVAGAVMIALAPFLIMMESPKWFGASAAFIIGIVLLFSREGIDIDKAGNRYKEWSRWLGIRVGVWKPLDVFENVSVILETDSGHLAAVTENTPEETEDYYQVHMLNDTQHYKVFVCQHKKKSLAESKAKELANWLGLKTAIYNPVRQHHKR